VLEFLLAEFAHVGAGGEPEDELGIDLLFALLVDLLGVGDARGLERFSGGLTASLR